MSNFIVRLPEVRAEQGAAGTSTRLTGCKLVYRKGPDDETGEELGVVVAAPSVPMWLSRDFPQMVDRQAQDPDFRLEDYSIEWFEKILFVKSDNGTNVARWATELARLNTTFDHRLSNGCSRVTASSPVYEVKVDADSGTVLGTEMRRSYYTLVTKSDADDPTVALEITIAERDQASAFALTQQHKDALSDCKKLYLQVDPERAALSAQRDILDDAVRTSVIDESNRFLDSV